MKRISGDLCKAESMAHQVPLPQIQRYDMPTWNLKEIMTSSSLSACKSVCSVTKEIIHTFVRTQLVVG